MDRRLIYEDQHGYLRIIVPNSKFQQPQESHSEALARLAAGFLPDVTQFFVCVPTMIPSDLTFRDAWRLGDKTKPIKIDFQKAIEIHRTRLKEACDKKIDQLSKEMVIAFEKMDLPESVAIGRTTQALRTIPEGMNLTHCKNVDDVKYSIPRELFDVWTFYNPERV